MFEDEINDFTELVQENPIMTIFIVFLISIVLYILWRVSSHARLQTCENECESEIFRASNFSVHQCKSECQNAK